MLAPAAHRAMRLTHCGTEISRQWPPSFRMACPDLSGGAETRQVRSRMFGWRSASCRGISPEACTDLFYLDCPQSCEKHQTPGRGLVSMAMRSIDGLVQIHILRPRRPLSKDAP